MIFNEVNESKSEININDTIGFWGLTHQDFSNQLSELEGKDIQLNIASFGGVVTDAFAMYNSLKSYSGRITANIYGDSASAATFIAMAADEIKIADNVLMLVHNVQGMAVGDTKEMEKTIDLMEKMNANIVDVYKKKTGLNKSTIKKFMNAEEWWTAKEAKANGFVDKVVEASEIIRENTLVNCVDERLKEKLVNKLNNNKNQTTMAEEKKETSKVDALIEGMSNFFAPKVETPVVENVVAPVVEDNFSQEDVDSIMNAAKVNANELTEANTVIVNAKDDEISKLKAELEKASNTATNVDGGNNESPEANEKPVVVNAFLSKTAARIINKYKID